MSSGYVLTFSDRSFAEFVDDSTGLNVFDVKYKHASGSKANRLRASWKLEGNAVVGKLLGDWLSTCDGVRTGALAEECRGIAARLKQGTASARTAPSVVTTADLGGHPKPANGGHLKTGQ